MTEKVFLIATEDNCNDGEVAQRLKDFIVQHALLDFVKERDMVALKTHFGESKGSGYPRPELVQALGEVVSAKGALPFLTETSTLYKGDRSNAVEHAILAHRHGFSFENTGMPIIMADGLLGDEEIEVPVPGELYDKVKIAALLERVQGMILLSHFTGHLASGFGGALKNLGMGLASRKGKMIQHSTAQPSIRVEKCTRCGVCLKWCPVSAISMTEESALIDEAVCIGCGECLAVCRFDAVGYNWAVTYKDLQKKIVEHAWGAHRACGGPVLYINVLTRISKDCDCITSYEKIVPDIGILISTDPVAIDAASLALIEERSGKKLADLAYNIPYMTQIDHAKRIGFGSTDFEVVSV